MIIAAVPPLDRSYRRREGTPATIRCGHQTLKEMTLKDKKAPEIINWPSFSVCLILKFPQ
ncbi:hypothetical protein AB205_0031370 [Aquarana catesbeiana]|uniref:Uncharacterized protein n=1 Tax=Aquarana catesbeiana TaxID=8400 RepID=A0A2G9RJF8_AQUCT|nr:hypothetical protein AB205_0031370 [Aquarana catesbeiana]